MQSWHVWVIGDPLVTEPYQASSQNPHRNISLSVAMAVLPSPGQERIGAMLPKKAHATSPIVSAPLPVRWDGYADVPDATLRQSSRLRSFTGFTGWHMIGVLQMRHTDSSNPSFSVDQDLAQRESLNEPSRGS